ncbi:MAG: ADP-ribosylglycohydrolase family protein [Pseudomonadota bacterium]
MTSAADRARAAVMGAYVADCATMGLHWLYDQQRIAEVAGDQPEFRAPNKADFADKGYFAHGGKSVGEPSHYGAQMLAMAQSVSRSGGFDVDDYAASFREWFDYGGRWVGYADRPTRATLAAMAEASANDRPISACGADDAQLPAVSKLPPLVAAHYDDADLPAMVEAAVRVTNDRDDSVAWGQATARMIAAAIKGASLSECVTAARDGATDQIQEQIDGAARMSANTTSEVASAYALHCQLEKAFPVLIHTIAGAEDFTSAVRANIAAGGDNCGRAIPIGAVLGAVFAGNPHQETPSNWRAMISAPAYLVS